MIARLQVCLEIPQSYGMLALGDIYEIASVEKDFHAFRRCR